MLNSPLVGAHGAFFSTPNKPKILTSSSQKSSPQLKHIPLTSLNTNSPMGYYCPKSKESSPLKGRGLSRNAQREDTSIQLQTSMSKSNIQLNTSGGIQSMFHLKMNDYLSSNVLNSPIKNSSSKLTLETCASPITVKKVQKTAFDSSSARLRNIMTPTLPKEKIIEKWPSMSVQNSPNNTKTNSFLFMENKKKYRITKVPALNQVGKEFLNSGNSALEEIKQNVRLQGLKKYRPNPSCKIDLKEMGEIFMVKKSGQPLTREEEVQVRLLKKKVEISKVFSLKNMDDEDRKAYYRNLLLEFHPDKCKHDPEFSVAIFHFLQTNKERFIGF